jgi:hypothetical protein
LRTLVDGLIQQVGELRDNFVHHRVLLRRAEPLASGRMSSAPGRFAPIPVPSFGCLVPIKELIRAEDPPTASSSGSSIQWSDGSGGCGDSQSLLSQPVEVRDFAAEEEEQAEEEEAETFHQEILRARADTALEYRLRSPNLPGFDKL